MKTPRSILIAEDDEGWRELLTFWLSGAGFHVISVANGKGVLPLAKKNPPDCFLLDHDLGDTTGVEVCRAIKADAKLKRKPVIILTANLAVMSRLSLDERPNHLIIKSRNPDELLAVLGASLREA